MLRQLAKEAMRSSDTRGLAERRPRISLGLALIICALILLQVPIIVNLLLHFPR